MKTIKVILVAGLGLCLAGGLGMTVSNVNDRRPDVTAIAVKTVPKIDGLLKDTAWLQVAQDHRGVMAGWTMPGLGDGPNRGLATQQRIGYVCYDANNLYVALQAMAVDIYQLKAGTDGSPFTGDCLEIHINTPSGKYFQFGIDIDDNLGTGDVPSGTTCKGLKGKSEFGPNFWTAEVMIPWKVLGMVPKPGLRFGFNLAANIANQGTEKEAWTPLTWGRSYTVKKNETLLELR